MLKNLLERVAFSKAKSSQADTSRISYCEGCEEVCTPQCRKASAIERVRDSVLNRTY